MADLREEFLNQDRTKELWTAIKAHVKDEITTELENYATDDGVAAAIVAVLQNYPNNEEMAHAITDALTDYMTKSEINDAILQAIGDITRVRMEIVDQLPEQGEKNIIYLIPSDDPHEKNERDEYVWLGDKYEKIGSTKIDLTNYWSKDELKPMSPEALAAILV